MLALLLVLLAPADGLDLSTTTRPALGGDGLAIVEIRAVLDGIPLVGPLGHALVDQREGGRVLLTTAIGTVFPLADQEVRIDEAHALATLAGSGLPGSQGAQGAELVAVPGSDCTRLFWRIDPPADRTHLTNPVFLVDALTGAIRMHGDRARHALVRSFLRNPVLDPVAGEYTLSFIDPEHGNLSGPYFVAKNCIEPIEGIGCAPAHIAAADADGNFLYPTPNIDDPADAGDIMDEFAEVSAYYHADKFHAHLLEMGLPGMACHASGEQATLVANYTLYLDGQPQALDNATYTGDCSLTVVLGQGKDVDWAYDGDVIYHEVSHGVIAHLMGPNRILGARRDRPDAVATDAGAMNEAIADFLGSTFAGDPVHGEYVSQYGPAQGRNADNDYTCPAALVGEVHFDSEIFSGALWDAHQALGEPFVLVVLDAVPLLAEDALFEEAAAIIETTAEAELGTSAADTVREIFTERGLVDCPRMIPWDALQRDEMWLVPKSLQGFYDPMRPPPVQVMFDVPKDADTLEISFDVEVFPPPMWEPLADINVIVKHDAPITFTYETSDDTVLVDADSDQHIWGLNDGYVDLAVTGGETLYAAFFNLGVHTAALSNLSAEFTQVGEDTDSGTTDADDTGALDAADVSVSCACGQPSERANRLHALALIVVISAMRRRRYS
jgi:hypothetical protein